MSDDDVYGNDMMHNLSDDELETALTGRDIEGLNAHPVALFLSDAARSLQDVQPPAPSAALAEFVGIRSQLPLKQQTQQAPPVTEEVLDLRLDAPKRKKRKMMSSAMAFAATTTGKIVLGTSAAVAAVGGAQASGVVDVVPDIASTDSSAPESTTTSSTVAPTADPLPLVSPDVTTPATPATPPAEVPTTVGVSDQVLVIPVGDAGTVTVMSIDGALLLVTVDPGAGWTIESSGSYEDEVEVVFSDASNQVKLKVEFEHGVFKVKIEDLLTGLETESFYDENGNPIEKPIDDSDDDDSDYDDDDDDDSDHDDDSDDDDDDDNKSDHDDDDDDDDDDDNKSDHDDDDDDDKSDKSDKSDDDDDDKSDDDDDNKSDHDDDDDKSDDDSGDDD